MNIRWTSIAIVALLAACSSEPTESDPVADAATDTGSDATDDTGGADTTPKPDVAPEPDAEADATPDAVVDATEDTGPPPPPPTRPRRRMDLDQLEASMARTTGTAGWVRGNGNSRFEQLSATLGVPDYIRRTAEDLTASVVFSKFLSDAARDVCTTAIRDEAGLEDPAGRVLLRHVEPTDTVVENEAAIRANLAYLLLRFHGVSLEPDDAQIQPWVDLIETVQAEAEDPALAWRTVCVGLLLHPAFVSY